MDKQTTIHVREDGSHTEEIDIRVRIHTEDGRQRWSTQIFNYNAHGERVEILEADTTYDGVLSPVDKEKIEDKPIASSRAGLSDDKQILVPFENTTIGCEVHLRYSRLCQQPIPESGNYFGYDIEFMGEPFWQRSTTRIESPSPLFFKVNDPEGHLGITQSHEGGKHILEISLRKPLVQFLVGEPEDSRLDPQVTPYVSISTEQDYQRIGQAYGRRYESVWNRPLPDGLQRIKATAAGITDEKELLDTLVAGLIEKMTYLGSWNSLEGGRVPRSLEKIISSGYGDCKEGASCIVAILNTLPRYKARVVLVKRGTFHLPRVHQPHIEQFDHAIVKVVGPSGTTYWIDPTNETTMTGGVYPDIADRCALVLDSETPTYEQIPPIDYRHSLRFSDETIIEEESGLVRITAKNRFEGEAAQTITAYSFKNPPSFMKELVRQEILQEGIQPLDFIVILPEEASRKVGSFEITHSYRAKNVIPLANKGRVWSLGCQWPKNYVGISPTHEGTFFVGSPGTLIFKTTFKNTHAENLDRLAFSIDTPWLKATRELTSDGDIIVTDTVNVLRSYIPPHEFKSPEFEDMVRMLRKYCRKTMIVTS